MAQRVFIFIQIPQLWSFIVASISSLFLFLLSVGAGSLPQQMSQFGATDGPRQHFPLVKSQTMHRGGRECDISGSGSLPAGQYPVYVYFCVMMFRCINTQKEILPKVLLSVFVWMCAAVDPAHPTSSLVRQNWSCRTSLTISCV